MDKNEIEKRARELAKKLTERSVGSVYALKGEVIANYFTPLITTALTQVAEDAKKEAVDKLANFIMADVDGEPSEDEGAVDCAIRIIKQQTERIEELEGILYGPSCKRPDLDEHPAEWKAGYMACRGDGLAESESRRNNQCAKQSNSVKDADGGSCDV